MQDLLSAWPIAIALVFTGSIAGILAGLFGIGGGLIIVPVLFFLFQYFGVSTDSAMLIATATSLATIVPTALSSTRAHFRNGNVDIQILKLWAPVILVSSIVGSIIASRVAGSFLTWIFGLMVILVSLNMVFRAGAPALFARLPGKLAQTFIAALVGGISVMIGIGGATIGVPLLTSCNVKAHTAVGTSAAFGLLIALPGALTLLFVGTTPSDAPVGTWQLVNMPAFLLIIPLTVSLAPVGAMLGKRLNQIYLKRAFALLLFITGSHMLLDVAL